MLKITKILALLVGVTLILASCNSSRKDIISTGSGAAGYVIKGLFVKADKACEIQGKKYEKTLTPLKSATGTKGVPDTKDTKGAPDTKDTKFVNINETGQIDTSNLPSGDYFIVTCTGKYIDESTGSTSKTPITLTGFFSKENGIHNLNAFTTLTTDELKAKVVADIQQGKKKGFDVINEEISQKVIKDFYLTNEIKVNGVTDLSLLNSVKPTSGADIALLAANLNIVANLDKLTKIDGTDKTKRTLAPLYNEKGEKLKTAGLDSYTKPLKRVDLDRVANAIKRSGLGTAKLAGLDNTKLGDPDRIAFSDIATATLLTNEKGTPIANASLNNGLIVLPRGTTKAYVPESIKAEGKDKLFYTTDDGKSWIEVKVPITTTTKLPVVDDSRKIFVDSKGIKTVILATATDKNKLPKEHEVLTTKGSKDSFTAIGYFLVVVSTDSINRGAVVFHVDKFTFGTNPLKADDSVNVVAVTDKDKFSLTPDGVTLDNGLKVKYAIVSSKTKATAIHSLVAKTAGLFFGGDKETTFTVCAFDDKTADADVLSKCTPNAKAGKSGVLSLVRFHAKIRPPQPIAFTANTTLGDVALTQGNPLRVSMVTPLAATQFVIDKDDLQGFDLDASIQYILMTQAGTNPAKSVFAIKTGASIPATNFAKDGITTLIFCIGTANAKDCNDNANLIGKSTITVTTYTPHVFGELVLDDTPGKLDSANVDAAKIHFAITDAVEHNALATNPASLADASSEKAGVTIYGVTPDAKGDEAYKIKVTLDANVIKGGKINKHYYLAFGVIGSAAILIDNIDQAILSEYITPSKVPATGLKIAICESDVIFVPAESKPCAGRGIIAEFTLKLVASTPVVSVDYSKITFNASTSAAGWGEDLGMSPTVTKAGDTVYFDPSNLKIAKIRLAAGVIKNADVSKKYYISYGDVVHPSSSNGEMSHTNFPIEIPIPAGLKSPEYVTLATVARQPNHTILVGICEAAAKPVPTAGNPCGRETMIGSFNVIVTAFTFVSPGTDKTDIDISKIHVVATDASGDHAPAVPRTSTPASLADLSATESTLSFSGLTDAANRIRIDFENGAITAQGKYYLAWGVPSQTPYTVGTGYVHQGSDQTWILPSKAANGVVVGICKGVFADSKPTATDPCAAKAGKTATPIVEFKIVATGATKQ